MKDGVNSEYFRLIRYVVTCVGILGLTAIIAGAILAIKGYNEANTMILIGGGCTSGLLALVSIRGHQGEDKPAIPPAQISEQTTKTETTTKSAEADK